MKTILLIKIGAIGDVIMTLPVVSEIKKQYPQAKISWICGTTVLPILQSVPQIDEIFTISENNLFNSNKLVAIRELLSFNRKVAFKKFDAILNFHVDKRYKIIHAGIRTGKFLKLDRFPGRPTLIAARSKAFEHVRLFLQQDDNYTACLQFPADTISGDLAGLPMANELRGKKLVILSPGGAKNILNEQELRRWPIENYVQVADTLTRQGFRVVITGAPSDDWVRMHFAHLPVTDLVGKLSLLQLITLMRNSSFVITHDSGPYHLAVFAAVPQVITLFGPTNPQEFTYGKNFKKIHVLWGGENLLCSPCYDGKYFSLQCKNNICMQNTTVLQVLETVLKLNEPAQLIVA